jgi:hypothetical protein
MRLDASIWNSDSDFIFARSDGRPVNPDHLREQVLYPTMKAAQNATVKHESGIHALRHSAGSIWYEMTRDMSVFTCLGLGSTRDAQ